MGRQNRLRKRKSYSTLGILNSKEDIPIEAKLQTRIWMLVHYLPLIGSNNEPKFQVQFLSLPKLSLVWPTILFSLSCASLNMPCICINDSFCMHALLHSASSLSWGLSLVCATLPEKVTHPPPFSRTLIFYFIPHCAIAICFKTACHTDCRVVYGHAHAKPITAWPETIKLRPRLQILLKWMRESHISILSQFDCFSSVCNKYIYDHICSKYIYDN